MESHGTIVVRDLTPSIEIITFTGSFTATFKPPAKNPESDIANTPYLKVVRIIPGSS